MTIVEITCEEFTEAYLEQYDNMNREALSELYVYLTENYSEAVVSDELFEDLSHLRQYVDFQDYKEKHEVVCENDSDYVVNMWENGFILVGRDSTFFLYDDMKVEKICLEFEKGIYEKRTK